MLFIGVITGITQFLEQFNFNVRVNILNVNLYKKGEHHRCSPFFIKQINYLTSSLNFLPAVNAGTVLAAIFKAAPV